MFQAGARPSTHRKLYVVATRRAIAGNRQGEVDMNAYRFAAYPSNSSVASGVTMLVSLWFLVAAGAILTDSSPAHARPMQAAAAPAIQYAEEGDAPFADAIAIAPQARFTITVEAHRADAAHRAITAHRSVSL
jgi:hypothetical protein